ncbi:tyrS [Acrasis kona]|uniref:TyrS n=1 Tax=Acrasis kona TaxID=1008807 RepID=A0AAW2YUQ8_9EUKA
MSSEQELKEQLASIPNHDTKHKKTEEYKNASREELVEKFAEVKGGLSNFEQQKVNNKEGSPLIEHDKIQDEEFTLGEPSKDEMEKINNIVAQIDEEVKEEVAH